MATGSSQTPWPFCYVPTAAQARAGWARRTESTPLTREGYDSTMPALFASDGQKAMNRNATTKVRLELVKHEGGQFAAP